MQRQEDIQETLTYLRDHITEDVNTEMLAMMAHFSRYHYHRLFYSVMGVTAARYILTQKLQKGLEWLLTTDATVTDIAYALNFHSQDVFTRAFKRSYHEAPVHLRKKYMFYKIFNAYITNITNKKLKGVKIVMDTLFDPRLPFMFPFTAEDKRHCLPTVALLTKLSVTARKEGLLALEDTANREGDNLFIKKGIALICDGLPPAIVKEILTNYLLSAPRKNAELLKRLLIMEGVMSIQSGENTSLLRERLLSLLGEDFYDDACLYLGIGINSQNEILINEYFNDMNTEIYPEGTNLLEEAFLPLDNYTIQLILRETSQEVFFPAFRGSAKKLQKRLTENLGTSLAVQVIKLCLYEPAPEASEIIKAQHSMLSNYHKILSSQTNS